MAIHVAQDVAKKNRSIVPTGQLIEDKLKAEPVLWMWRRLIDTAVVEAKVMRFGEPTDHAILARWWIEQPDDIAASGAEFRATFERACLLLSLDVVTERAALLKDIDQAWQRGYIAYAGKRLELRRRAVLTTAKASTEMTKTLALLVISHVDYEETAGINRADPPARTQRHTHPRLDAPDVTNA